MLTDREKNRFSARAAREGRFGAMPFNLEALHKPFDVLVLGSKTTWRPE
jgi:hypothetical protein